jgi:hypothetical protein
MRFKTSQINDILKSLVLQDEGGGKIASVNYASQEPLARKLKSFQVDISGTPSLGDLLGQLRGAKVTIAAGDRTVSGTILGVEKKQVGAGQAVVDRTVINIFSGGTIRSEQLDEVREVKLEDPVLQEELGRALEAMAGARDQEKKSVTLKFNGVGERKVHVGYVVETPVWKTSYRLILNAKKASIQGWAIVENQTDRDWDGVELSLVSGRPISFVQDLYTPLFIPRPVVMTELYASIKPMAYDEGMEGGKRELATDYAMRANKAGLNGDRALSRAALAGGGGNAAYTPPPGEVLMDPTASVQSVASATKIGELFQYTVGNVSLPRQTSAMIPIITDPVEVERVSIYNAGVLPRNPLTGARVKNTTGKHLLAGPITVLEDGGYAGDARIDNVPPGQERLVSFGVDLQVLVDATQRRTVTKLQSAKISKGVIEFSNRTVDTQEYLIENKSDAEKTVIVEHPRKGGDWKLVDSPKPDETTDAVYRFKGQVAAGKQSKLVISDEIIGANGIVLVGLQVDNFVRFQSNTELPGKVRDALAKAITLKQAVVDTERQIEERKARIAEMTAEQQRIRENMKTIQPTSDYAQRLLKKLNDQESAIEKLQGEIESLTKDADGQRKAFEDYVAKLEV